MSNKIIEEFVGGRTPHLSEVYSNDNFTSILSYEKSGISMKVNLPLVLSRKKRGMTGGVWGEKWKVISKNLIDLGVPHIVKNGSEINKESDSLKLSIFYISYNTRNLQKVDVRKENEEFGRFLGVPEKDNKWYDENDMPTIEKCTPLPDYLNLEKEKWRDLFYIKMIPWICRPTREALRRNIRIGKSWHDTLYNLSKLDIPEPLEAANRDVHSPCMWYDFKEDLPKNLL